MRENSQTILFKKISFTLILILSMSSASCDSEKKISLKNVSKSSDPSIASNENRIYKLLGELIVAEKRHAVKHGYYTDLKELKEKGFITFVEQTIMNMGYEIRIEYTGVKELRIYTNPIKYIIIYISLAYFNRI